MCSTGWRTRASRPPSSTCTTSPTRSNAHLAGAARAAASSSPTSAANCSIPAAAWSRRCRRLGAAPFFHLNSDTLWIDGVTPNLDAPCASVRCRTHGRAAAARRRPPTSIGYAGRGDFAWRRTAGSRAGAEREVAPFVYAGVAILSPALFADAPTGAFSLNLLFDRADRRPAGSTACGSKACGCMSARPRRSPPPKRRSWRARRDC